LVLLGAAKCLTVEIVLSQLPQRDSSVPIQTVIRVNVLDVPPDQKNAFTASLFMELF
jgi:hypothetical protein